MSILHIRKAQQISNMLFLEGNIGAGKSSFLQILADTLKCEAIFEPASRWQETASPDNKENILELFYKNPKRWAYTFETYTLLTRLSDHQLYANSKSNSNHNRVIISERSPYSGRHCFATNTYKSGHFTQLEWALYESICEFVFSQHVAQPTGIIYLKTSPEICYERLKTRNRSEESGVPLKYLQEIHERHENWLLNKPEAPVLTLDGNLNYLNNQENKEKLIHSVSDYFRIAKHSENFLGSTQVC